VCVFAYVEAIGRLEQVAANRCEDFSSVVACACASVGRRCLPVPIT
jgi:hypothetical protein